MIKLSQECLLCRFTFNNIVKRNTDASISDKINSIQQMQNLKLILYHKYAIFKITSAFT